VRVSSSTGTLLATFGSNQNGDFELDLPRGIAVDQVGNVYVANTDEGEIKKLTPD
jgi:DNA-binding beta-propeller fold protein YncE